jgi:integrase
MGQGEKRKGLTTKRVAALTEPGRHIDNAKNPGLYLQITDAGVKSFLFRYQRGPRERWMGLGPLHTVSLAEARIRARAARLKLLDGIDPLDHKRRTAEASAVEAAKHKTFEEVARAYLKAHDEDWKNAKHARQWEASLFKDCKAIANLPVAAIDTSHVMEVLQPIWRKKPETASRTRARIERVLAFAVAAQYRKREDGNPARWDGHLQELLGKKSAAARAKRQRSGKDNGGHHVALPYAELPAFMVELRKRNGIGARALEFTILTAARTGETVGARWDEIELKEKLWIVPANRIKMGKEHRVPLSDRALELLRALPREDGNPYLFVGARKGTPLSLTALLPVVKDMRPGLTVHGFRSTFKDWVSDRTHYPREVSEMALAHAIPDKVEAAYRRGELLDKRRKLMEAWAEYTMTKPVAATGETVVPMRKAR